MKFNSVEELYHFHVKSYRSYLPFEELSLSEQEWWERAFIRHCEYHNSDKTDEQTD